MSAASLKIAQTILEGFKTHYRLFQSSTNEALELFTEKKWKDLQNLSKSRISFYDNRVAETFKEIQSQYNAGELESLKWDQIKKDYVGLLLDIEQPELAETFFNTVICKLLDRKYFNNEYIFFRPTLSTEHIESEKPTYYTYEINSKNFFEVSHKILHDLGLANKLKHKRRNIRKILLFLKSINNQIRRKNFSQVQIISSLFIRNKGAYLVGKFFNPEDFYPFAVAFTPNEDDDIEIDAILTSQEQLRILFNFSRAYFFVNANVPSGVVEFLKECMPNKPAGEIYSSIGLHKHGKTLFYRDFIKHLKNSKDLIIEAPGTIGLVMLVITLPSYPYVFKIIRDDKNRRKDVTADYIKGKYQLVKSHDRVGRLADTMEFKEVALPIERFDKKTIELLRSSASESTFIEKDMIIFKHVYIERRMQPLNLYINQEIIKEKLDRLIIDYGYAIKDLASANIFPGDMLSKNFGITQNNQRIVFYDYDEIMLMTDCEFKKIPESNNDLDEFSEDVWYPVGKNDVFPENFTSFLMTNPKIKDIFRKHHNDLFDVKFWNGKKQSIIENKVESFFPYHESIRLKNF